MNSRIMALLHNERMDPDACFQALPLHIREHSQAVAALTLLMLDWYRDLEPEAELPPLDRTSFERIVLYHDIGLSLIPAEILENQMELSGPEMRVIQRHAVYGGQILETQQREGTEHTRIFWQAAAETAASHHERWNGKGYPHGLLTSGIPLLSRIVAIADTYDSIVRGAPYRMPLPPEYAALEIVSNAGRQFDPHLAELFRKHCAALIEPG